MLDDASGGPDSKRKEEGSAAMRGVMNSDKVLVGSAGVELLKRPEDR